MTGFYCFRQLYSTRETKYQKERNGKFPWCKRTIERLCQRGEFPKPIKLLGRNAWRSDVIDKFAELITKGMALSEATVRAEAAVV